MPIDLTDQDILQSKWIGKKTGNLFAANRVFMDDGERKVSYSQSTGKEFVVAASSFQARFRPATQDELWKALTERTEVAEEAEKSVSDVGFLVEPTELDTFDRLVLYREAIMDVEIGLNKIARAAEMEEVWQLSKIEPRGSRSVINLYGPPGTGKTSAARAIAKRLNQKLFQVDYAEVISKYPGDTAKHIKMAFESATAHKAVLFFDEADSIVSRRIDMSQDQQSYATSINQNRNSLMQLLDKHTGVVLMSTNNFRNFDEAMLRRVAQHVEFKLPNVEMLKRIYDLHLPNKESVQMTDTDWDDVANASMNFSGGDVLNAVLNAITRVSLSPNVEEWVLGKADMIAEVTKIANAKAFHAKVPASH